MKSSFILTCLTLSLVILFPLQPVSAQTTISRPLPAADDVVRFEADVAGLPLIATNRQTAPRFGTFWLPSTPDSSGWLAPYPALPDWVRGDEAGNLNVYALPDGGLLVDTPDGTNVWARLNSISNTIQHAESLAATAQSASTMTALDAAGAPLPGGTNASGTNTFNPLIVTNPPVDYGSNLYVARWTLTNGVIVGAASNTLNVEYEWLTNDDLATTNWGHSGWTFYGSDVTNWTAFPALPTSATTNLFFRLLSYVSDDGSGIPTWWEELYGIEGVDPNAQDSAGDGWSYYQKYAMNVAPSVFVTPPAPKGLAATYNGNTASASITWLPSPGNVIGYQLTTPSGATNLPANTTSYTDTDPNLANDMTPFYYADNPDFPDYGLEAVYSQGNSPRATAHLTPSVPNIWLLPGRQGSNYLAVSTLPEGTTAIRILREDWDAEINNDDYAYSAYYDIPLSSFTNGLFYLPPGFTASPADAYGNPEYFWGAQSLNADAVPNGQLVSLGGNHITNAVYGIVGVPPLYLDGRTQLKENVVFQLRAADKDQPFGYYYGDAYDENLTVYPADYAFSGFYEPSGRVDAYNNSLTAGNFDPYLPFKDNYFYRNFVFSLADVEQGDPTTGIWSVYQPYPEIGFSVAHQFPPPNAGGVTVPSLLSATDSAWLITEAFYGANWDYSPNAEIGVSQDDDGYYHLSGTNYFGLPFQSVEIAYAAGSGTATTTLYPDTRTTNGGYFYVQTAQPELQTVEYDFWEGGGYYAADYSFHQWDLFPGEDGFATTNQTDQHLIVGLGSSIQVAGYAKEVLQNGVSGVYGYLGQYFDNAYQVDTNGDATTTPTGILSPYGSFFATQPGAAALVTMPDLDTGERGTGTVYCVSLTVDKNHDGTMDTYFAGPDATSQASPFVFWCDNNFDRWNYDHDDATNYMDDVQAGNNSDAAQNLDPNDPDCNYYDAYGNRIIPCTRDLEDFARLWVNGITTNLLAALPTNSTVTLSWGDVDSPNPGNPTIDLFQAADADGGIGYLTNETVATAQMDSGQSPYLGRLAPGGSLRLNAAAFAQGWAGNHFIMCGVSNGTGGLNLTIQDGSGNVLAQSTSYLQIVDIKQMYERWTIGDTPSIALKTNAVPATEDLPIGASAFQYTQPQDTNTPYILFVHGWNMERWEKDRFAESAFKRLYWQGYKGRFGVFRWPTENGFKGISSLATDPSEKDNFDRSEYTAWQSSVGLLNKLKDLNVEYPSHVYMLAHSMGNIVAGEALRLATQQGLGHLVNTYVASQAAVSAHTYDTNIANYSFNYFPWRSQAVTPNIYGNWFLGNNGGGAGQVVNFYNTNDYALQRSVWQLNQLLKPDQFVLLGGTHWDYSYLGMTNDPSPWNHFQKDASLQIWNEVNFDIVNVLTNRYEVMGLAAESYTTALGATPGVHNVADSIYLGRSTSRIWPVDTTGNNYAAHFWHSAEFRGDYWQQQGYWSELLGSDAFNLK